MITRRESLALGGAAALWPGVAAAAAVFPFRTTRNRAWTAVKINDKEPTAFLIDTGATGFGIVPALAEALALPRAGRSWAQTAVGRIDVPVFKAEKVVIGGAVRESEVHLAGMARPIGDDLKGIIPTAKFGVMGFDFDAQQVTISGRVDMPTDGYELLQTYVDESRAQGTGRRLGGVELSDRQFYDVRPVVDGLFDGEKVRVLIDTGAQPGLYLRSDYVKKRGLWDHYPTAVRSHVMSAARGTDVRVARAQRFQIGRVVFANPIVTLADPEDANEDGFGRFDAVVGMEYLRRLNFIADPAKRDLWIKPSKQITDGYRYDRAGVGIPLVEEQPIVAWVQPGGPAARAGLRPGDRVTGWRGNDGYYGLLWALMGAPGSKVEVQLQRGGRTELVSIQLEERI